MSQASRLAKADTRIRREPLTVETCDVQAELDRIIASFPPMPTFTIDSGLCGKQWWDGLDWTAPEVGFICTLKTKHRGRCRAVGSDGTVISECPAAKPAPAADVSAQPEGTST